MGNVMRLAKVPTLIATSGAPVSRLSVRTQCSISTVQHFNISGDLAGLHTLNGETDTGDVEGIYTINIGSRSCKELKEEHGLMEDGIYKLINHNGVTFHTFCDMTTDAGGWTLVASVHENNIFGKCTNGDRWSSQQGNDAHRPGGDGSWSNYATFGAVVGATSDDYKNPGYYDIPASDISVWHVPNKTPWRSWQSSAILRYHTETKLLQKHGGNLFQLFQRYPLEYDKGKCPLNNGPSSPVVFDFGNSEVVSRFYAPLTQREFYPSFIQFRVFNTENATMAMCSGVKAIGCNTERFCIGGTRHFPQDGPTQCGDFMGLALNGYGTGNDRSETKALIESTVLIFYH
ncbi:intelectin-1a-like [Heptranchias perlo]|uniref:intelectin-1a-like n=1 Tax=Heptranchias perlo TaxID=212740 RepID=UPI00355A4647